MDWLSFIAAIVAALAWPIGLVLTAAVLRQPIRELVAILTRLKYGDLELSFGEKSLKRLEKRAAEAIPPAPTTTVPALSISSELAKLAETSPRAAIIEAWIRVSNAAVAALKARGHAFPKGKFVPPGSIEKALSDAGILNNDQLGLLRQLRDMRNTAVHGTGFRGDAGAALQFIATASRLADHLERQGRAG